MHYFPFIQVSALILVDIIILAIWTGIDTPHTVLVTKSYVGVLSPLQQEECSVSKNFAFEATMIVYKVMVLLFGVREAIVTWEIPSEFSEAKYLAVAIYNIVIMGGVATLIAIVFGSTNAVVAVALKVVGMFLCSTCGVLMIMIPKLLIAQVVEDEIAGIVSDNF